MSHNAKVELTKKRIVKLQSLIKHWKFSNIASRRATAEIVELMLSERYEKKVA